jgi:hypothetical protein
MQRSGLAVTAAVVLSLVPAAPAALAAPYVPNATVFAADGGALVDVGYRNKKKYRGHCNRAVRRYSRYGWRTYRVRVCRSKYVKRYRHDYRHGHRRGAHGCISYGGFTVCF